MPPTTRRSPDPDVTPSLRYRADDLLARVQGYEPALPPLPPLPPPEEQPSLTQRASDLIARAEMNARPAWRRDLPPPPRSTVVEPEILARRQETIGLSDQAIASFSDDPALKNYDTDRLAGTLKRWGADERAFVPLVDARTNAPIPDVHIDPAKMGAWSNDGYVSMPRSNGTWTLLKRQPDGSYERQYDADPAVNPEDVVRLMRPLFKYQAILLPRLHEQAVKRAKEDLALQEAEAEAAEKRQRAHQRWLERSGAGEQFLAKASAAGLRAAAIAANMGIGIAKGAEIAGRGALKQLTAGTWGGDAAPPSWVGDFGPEEATGGLRASELLGDMAKAHRRQAGWTEGQAMTEQQIQELRDAVEKDRQIGRPEREALTPQQRADYSAVLEADPAATTKHDPSGTTFAETALGALPYTASALGLTAAALKPPTVGMFGGTLAAVLEIGDPNHLAPRDAKGEVAPWFAGLLAPFEAFAVPPDAIREATGGKTFTGDWRADILPDLLLFAGDPLVQKPFRALGRRVRAMSPRAGAEAVLDLMGRTRRVLSATEESVRAEGEARGVYEFVRGRKRGTPLATRGDALDEFDLPSYIPTPPRAGPRTKILVQAEERVPGPLSAKTESARGDYEQVVPGRKAHREAKADALRRVDEISEYLTNKSNVRPHTRAKLEDEMRRRLRTAIDADRKMGRPPDDELIARANRLEGEAGARVGAARRATADERLAIAAQLEQEAEALAKQFQGRAGAPVTAASPNPVGRRIKDLQERASRWRSGEHIHEAERDATLRWLEAQALRGRTAEHTADVAGRVKPAWREVDPNRPAREREILQARAAASEPVPLDVDEPLHRVGQVAVGLRDLAHAIPHDAPGAEAITGKLLGAAKAAARGNLDLAKDQLRRAGRLAYGRSRDAGGSGIELRERLGEFYRILYSTRPEDMLRRSPAQRLRDLAPAKAPPRAGGEPPSPARRRASPEVAYARAVADVKALRARRVLTPREAADALRRLRAESLRSTPRLTGDPREAVIAPEDPNMRFRAIVDERLAAAGKPPLPPPRRSPEDLAARVRAVRGRYADIDRFRDPANYTDLDVFDAYARARGDVIERIDQVQPADPAYGSPHRRVYFRDPDGRVRGFTRDIDIMRWWTDGGPGAAERRAGEHYRALVAERRRRLTATPVPDTTNEEEWAQRFGRNSAGRIAPEPSGRAGEPQHEPRSPWTVEPDPGPEVEPGIDEATARRFRALGGGAEEAGPALAPGEGGPVRERLRGELRRTVTGVSTEELDGALALFDARARAIGVSTDEYIETYQFSAEPGVVPPGHEGPVPAAAFALLPDGRRILRTFEGRHGPTTINTLVHELGHMFRRDVSGTDMEILEAAFGEMLQVGRAATNVTVAAEERFAHAFERWLADGYAPTDRLVPLFRRFRNWLIEIYRTVTHHERVRVSDDVRGVMDRLFMAADDAPTSEPRDPADVFRMTRPPVHPADSESLGGSIPGYGTIRELRRGAARFRMMRSTAEPIAIGGAARPYQVTRTGAGWTISSPRPDDRRMLFISEHERGAQAHGYGGPLRLERVVGELGNRVEATRVGGGYVASLHPWELVEYIDKRLKALDAGEPFIVTTRAPRPSPESELAPNPPRTYQPQPGAEAPAVPRPEPVEPGRWHPDERPAIDPRRPVSGILEPPEPVEPVEPAPPRPAPPPAARRPAAPPPRPAAPPPEPVAPDATTRPVTPAPEPPAPTPSPAAPGEPYRPPTATGPPLARADVPFNATPGPATITPSPGRPPVAVFDEHNRRWDVQPATARIEELSYRLGPGEFQARDRITTPHEQAFLDQMIRTFDRQRFSAVDTQTTIEGAPIVWRDEQGVAHVIVGNGRTYAARRAGVTGEIPVRWFQGTREEARRLAPASQGSSAAPMTVLQRAHGRVLALGLDITNAPRTIPGGMLTQESLPRFLAANPEFARAIQLTGETATDYNTVREILVGMLPQSVRTVAAHAPPEFSDAIAGAAPRLLALRAMRLAGRIAREYDALEMFERTAALLSDSGWLTPASLRGSTAHAIAQLRELVETRGGLFGAGTVAASGRVSKLDLGFMLGIRSAMNRQSTAEVMSRATTRLYEMALEGSAHPGQLTMWGPPDVDVGRIVQEMFGGQGGGAQIARAMAAWDGPIGFEPPAEALVARSSIFRGERLRGYEDPRRFLPGAREDWQIRTPEDIAAWVSDQTGVPLRFGATAPDTHGVYGAHGNLAMVDDPRALRTSMHEIAHGLTRTGWFELADVGATGGTPQLGKIPTSVRKTLFQSWGRIAGDRYSPAEWLEEGFVDGIAEWLVNNSLYGALKPFGDWFDAWRAANPRKARILERAQSWSMAYQLANPVKIAESHFALPGGDTIWTKYGPRRWFSYMRMAAHSVTHDSVAPLERWVRDVVEHSRSTGGGHVARYEDIPTSLLPDQVLRNAKETIPARVSNYILHGELEVPPGSVKAAGGVTKGPSLPDIATKAGSLDDLHDALVYLTVRHLDEVQDPARLDSAKLQIAFLRDQITRKKEAIRAQEALLGQAPPAGQAAIQATITSLSSEVGGYTDQVHHLQELLPKLAPKTMPIARSVADGAARELMGRWAQQGRAEKMREVVDDLREFIDRPLKLLADEGIVSPESYALLNRVYPWYVSLARDTKAEEAMTSMFSAKGGQGFSRVPSPIRRLVGFGGGKLQNPLDALTHTVGVKIDAATRASVANAMIRFADANPGTQGWIRRVPSQNTLVRGAGELNPEGAEYVKTLRDLGYHVPIAVADELRSVVANMSALQGRHNLLTAWRGGKQVLYEIDPTMSKAFGLLGRPQQNVLMKLFSIPASMVRLGATGMDVAFSLWNNPSRDLSTAAHQGEGGWGAILTRAKRGVRNTLSLWGRGVPSDAAPFRWARELLHEDILSAYRASGLEHASLISGDIRRGTRATGPAAWLDLGSDVDRAMNVMRRRIDPTATGLKRAYQALIGNRTSRVALNIATHPIESIRTVLAATEFGPRLAEFERVIREMGWVPGREITYEMIQRAARAASEVTIDFRRSGSLSRWISQVSPFHNASVQGTSKFVRSMRRNPLGSIARGVAFSTVPSIIEWYHGHDRVDWQEAPPWQRSLFYTLPMPGGAPALRIPRAPEWGFWFGVVPQLALDGSNAGAIFKAGLANTIPPLRVAAMAPYDAARNWDPFREVPLYPVAAGERIAPQHRYMPWTTGMSKALSKEMAQSKLWKAAFGEAIPPVAIDYVLNGYTGGMYGDIVRWAGATGRIFTGDPNVGLWEIPVAGAPFAKPAEGVSVKQLRTRLKELGRERRDFLSQADEDRLTRKWANRLYDQRPEAGEADRLEAAAAKINQIRREAGDDRAKMLAALRRAALIARIALGKPIDIFHPEELDVLQPGDLPLPR